MTDTAPNNSGIDLTTWRELLSDWGRTGSLRRQSAIDAQGDRLAMLRAELAADAAERFVPPTGPLGDFEIVREIGRGGMGIVYEAHQRSVDRRVALKLLPASEWLDPQRIERFGAEARAAAALHHTNIVPVFSQGHEQGVHFLAMQFIDGISLDQLDDRAARYTLGSRSTVEQAIADIGRQAADALDYAHRQGVIHRDVKPGNLLLDRHGTIWLSDFGLARSREAEDLTATGAILGTHRYMAPECFRGEADARSDVYSLGATLFELVAHEPAFGSDDSPWDRQPRPLHSLVPGISRDLQTIIARAMDPDPDCRYQSAAALAKDLENFLAGEPIVARRIGWCGRTLRWCHKNPALASMTSLAILLLMTLTAGSIAAASHFRHQAMESRELARSREAARWARQVGFDREQTAKAEATSLKQQSERDSQRAEALTRFLVSEVIRDLRPDRRLGRPLSARSILDHAAGRVETVFADQPATAASIQMSLGESYDALGLHLQAIDQLQRAVKNRHATLGPQHRETLAATSLLATALTHQGRLAQALELHQQAYDGLRDDCTAPDCHVLMARHNLGLCLLKMCRFEQALEHYEKVVADRIRIDGPDHVRTLKAMNNLMLCLKGLRRIEEALPLSENTLAARKRTLGNTHPDTLSAMHNHAQMLGLMKRYSEAQTLYTQTLEIKRRTLGAEHPFTLNTRHNLANILLRLGKAREAEAINRDVLTIRRRVIGPHHPSTLKTQANLGRTLIRQRRLDEAETELQAAWTAQVAHRGESHSDTLATKRTLDHCLALSARQSRTRFVGIRKTSKPNQKHPEKQIANQKTASHP
tara:strand:- start:4596 stop:7055 length:2460 start_codon:yes stop_codon:yes gene_type:complete